MKMGYLRVACSQLILTLLLLATQTHCAALKDVLDPDTQDVLQLDTETLQRIPRDNKYYLSRYGSAAGGSDEPAGRTLKPEESPEARQGEANGSLEKRCSRCGDYDRANPYDRYDSRSRYNDDRYEVRRNRYPDYEYDRGYDRGYDRYDRYDKYDRGYDNRYDRYDRYDRDRYDRFDRYDRDNRDNRDNRDRNYDRGVGYDNRGYDYRSYDRRYDDLLRGYSGGGAGGAGLGGGSRPDYYGTGGGYASSWYYGGRGDDYYRDRGYQGYGGYRTRDPYYYDTGYRGTSYLYGRPSSTTTISPQASQEDNSATNSPQQTNSPSG